MILRKPYAFIIKHFRLIHLVILGCLGYLIYNFSSINGLVDTLVNSRIYTYTGADIYINKTVYTFIFVGLSLSGVLLWLLRTKKKPTGLYAGFVAYFIVSAVAFIYFYSLLGKLMESSLEIDQLTTFKDLLLLVRVPGYILSAMAFIRGIGFNLKQFNFSKDIEELKIAEKDSEEFELMVGQNNYKYARFIRRTLREISYYIRENLIAITIFGFVILAALIVLGIRYYNLYLKRLKAQEVKTINGITYVVNRSYITEEDYLGNKIKDGSKFVIVNMSFNNTTSTDKTLDYDSLRLVYDKLIYVPTASYNSKFYDMGVPYEPGTSIPQSSMLERYIVFEIPSSIKSNDFTLRVEYGVTNKNTKVIANYIKFQINTTEADTEDIVNNINLNSPMNPDVLNENRFTLTIKKYTIQENYNDRYVICGRNSDCKSYNNLISANKEVDKTMMIFDIDGLIYEEANFTKRFKTYNEIFSNFATITYMIDNRIYKRPVSIVSTNVDGKAFVLVDREILKASTYKITFTFRNSTYDIILK